jgi:hypothetical protein
MSFGECKSSTARIEDRLFQLSQERWYPHEFKTFGGGLLVQDYRFRFLVFGLRVSGLKFRVEDLRFRV